MYSVVQVLTGSANLVQIHCLQFAINLGSSVSLCTVISQIGSLAQRATNSPLARRAAHACLGKSELAATTIGSCSGKSLSWRFPSANVGAAVGAGFGPAQPRTGLPPCRPKSLGKRRGSPASKRSKLRRSPARNGSAGASPTKKKDGRSARAGWRTGTDPCPSAGHPIVAGTVPENALAATQAKAGTPTGAMPSAIAAGVGAGPPRPEWPSFLQMACGRSSLRSTVQIKSHWGSSFRA